MKKPPLEYHCILATFEEEADLLAATNEVRERGLKITDVFTPYAVHGLEKAMGLPPSRLTWVCFVCGMIGACGMLWFEHWVAALSWAVDVGGKPWNSLPSDLPVAFESAILLAGFGSVFALFAVARLYPGKTYRPVIERVTDDRFVLVLEQTDAQIDGPYIQEILQPFNLVELEERMISTGGTH